MRIPKDIIINGQSLDTILTRHNRFNKDKFSLLLETDEQSIKRGCADLCHADLHNAKLNGFNLGKAKLREANLEGANLSNADLDWADLRKANLTGTNLRGADCSMAFLDEANLLNADLSGANFFFADLTGVKNLHTARGLESANFQEATIDPEIRKFLSTINNTAN